MTILERLNNDDRFAKSIGAKLTEVREGYACAEHIIEITFIKSAHFAWISSAKLWEFR